MESRLFRASRFWTSNASGAVLSTFGFVLLLTAVGTVAIWMSGGQRQVVLVFAGIFIYLVCLLLAFFPGNLVAYYPFAVEVNPEAGLYVIALFKKIFIPIEDVRDIQNSLLQGGYVVRLTRWHGLLKRFVIHWFFGPERQPLARAIREAIEHKNAQSRAETM